MIAMPKPDAAILQRRAEIAGALRRIVPGEGVIETPEELRAYETDGLTAYRQPPMLAVLPSTVGQVSAVLAYCHRNGVKVWCREEPAPRFRAAPCRSPTGSFLAWPSSTASWRSTWLTAAPS
jgi:hypothetical protein